MDTDESGRRPGTGARFSRHDRPSEDGSGLPSGAPPEAGTRPASTAPPSGRGEPPASGDLPSAGGGLSPISLRDLAHDIRSLLNGALLRADLLEMEGSGLTEDQRGHLERIRASVQQAVARLDEALGDRPNS